MSDTTFGIRLHETGGPDVLRWEELPLAAPARGEVLVRHTAIGLNYIDTYKRSGLYKVALPAGLGWRLPSAFLCLFARDHAWAEARIAISHFPGGVLPHEAGLLLLRGLL